MSVKNAQGIANQIQDRLGISIVSFSNPELEWFKAELESFLDLEVDTDELADPEDCEVEDEQEEC
jgi:hypothetical protein